MLDRPPVLVPGAQFGLYFQIKIKLTQDFLCACICVI